MTAHEFSVGVLQWLLVVMMVLGVALAIERVLEPPRRKRGRYWMRRDIHDQHRMIARNGFKSKQGLK